MVSIWICLRWRRVFQSWENLEAILENSCVFRSHLITKSLRLWPLAIPVVNPATFGTSPKSGGKFGNPKNTGSWEHPQQKKTPRVLREPAFFCWKQPLISLFNPRKLVFCSKKDLCSHHARKDFKESSTNLLFLFQTLFAGYIYIYRMLSQQTACFDRPQLWPVWAWSIDSIRHSDGRSMTKQVMLPNTLCWWNMLSCDVYCITIHI